MIHKKIKEENNLDKTKTNEPAGIAVIAIVMVAMVRRGIIIWTPRTSTATATASTTAATATTVIIVAAVSRPVLPVAKSHPLQRWLHVLRSRGTVTIASPTSSTAIFAIIRTLSRTTRPLPAVKERDNRFSEGLIFGYIERNKKKRRVLFSTCQPNHHVYGHPCVLVNKILSSHPWTCRVSFYRTHRPNLPCFAEFWSSTSEKRNAEIKKKYFYNLQEYSQLYVISL